MSGEDGMKSAFGVLADPFAFSCFSRRLFSPHSSVSWSPDWTVVLFEISYQQTAKASSVVWACGSSWPFRQHTPTR